jgi:hypothetical protein
MKQLSYLLVYLYIIRMNLKIEKTRKRRVTKKRIDESPNK